MLALLIGADGTVQEAKIVKSSGHADLDNAARSGMAQCTFKPGTVDGVPTAAWQMVSYIWSQDGAPAPVSTSP